MIEVVTAIITGITAFSATNIDDLAILLLLFSQEKSTFRNQQILFGQYLGFAVLVIASLPGFFGGLVISKHWIGLLGMIPISLGLLYLLNRQIDEGKEIAVATEPDEDSIFANLISPETYTVAAITVANGTDNISTYVPLFANSSLASLILILCVFFLGVGVWCYLAEKLTRNLAVADFLIRYSNAVVPFFLIGLGVFIVLDSQALSLMKLFLSCLCLIILLKDNAPSEELQNDN